MTEQDISKVLDKKEETYIFSEESNDLAFDTSGEDSSSVSDISSVVHKIGPYD
jgi:hypothetical protein